MGFTVQLDKSNNCLSLYMWDKGFNCGTCYKSTFESVCVNVKGYKLQGAGDKTALLNSMCDCSFHKKVVFTGALVIG